MIAGLPWTSWILMIVSVGLGLVIEIHFYLSHRRNQGAGLEDDEATTRRSTK